MNRDERRAARMQLAAALQQGLSWSEAVQTTGTRVCRATYYNWRRRWQQEGDQVLEDHRHGHPYKLPPPVQDWLVAYCRDDPTVSTRTVQAALAQHFGIRVGVRHLDRVR